LTTEGLDVDLVPAIGAPKVEGLARVEPDHSELRFPQSLVPSSAELLVPHVVDFDWGGETVKPTGVSLPRT
jgi:hypothetical protein